MSLVFAVSRGRAMRTEAPVSVSAAHASSAHRRKQMENSAETREPIFKPTPINNNNPTTKLSLRLPRAGDHWPDSLLHPSAPPSSCSPLAAPWTLPAARTASPNPSLPTPRETFSFEVDEKGDACPTRPPTRSKAPLRFGDCFSGAGGLSLGLQAAGLQQEFAVESCLDSQNTFRSSHAASTKLFRESVEGFLDNVGLYRKFLWQ